MGGFIEKQKKDRNHKYLSNMELNVCDRHFDDEDIISYIEMKRMPGLTCSFCEPDEDDSCVPSKNVMSWDVLIDRITQSIECFYDDPANILSYESSEGGYLGETYSTLELLQDEVGFQAEFDIVTEIAKSIQPEHWAEVSFYGDSLLDELKYTWDKFSFLVKHKVRFLFYENAIYPIEQSENRKPYLILKDISKYISELNLIISLPEKTDMFNQEISIYRARQHKLNENVDDCNSIGPAPIRTASANRFSPEGIPIFYGAEDEDTAILEIINPTKKDEYVSVGEFYLNMSLNMIDLRNINHVGFFNFEKKHLIEPSRFLQHFARVISERIKEPDNERIEYVPSQIVTEYFRHVLPSELNKTINGIIYKSALNSSKCCFAIFADSLLCSNEGEQDEETLLILKKNSINKTSVLSKV